MLNSSSTGGGARVQAHHCSCEGQTGQGVGFLCLGVRLTFLVTGRRSVYGIVDRSLESNLCLIVH